MRMAGPAGKCTNAATVPVLELTRPTAPPEMAYRLSGSD